MKAIALVQPPHDPAAAGALLGYLLGEGWSVHGYTSQDEVPDEALRGESGRSVEAPAAAAAARVEETNAADR